MTFDKDGGPSQGDNRSKHPSQGDDGRQNPPRRDDWPEKMLAEIAAAERRPFSWGSHDCATFAAGVVAAMTGSDPMADLRGTYSDAASAQAAIKRAGHASLYHLLADRFGPTIPPAHAGRGDLALAHGDDGPALGIVDGAGVVFLGAARIGDVTTDSGTVRVPKSDVQHFFKV